MAREIKLAHSFHTRSGAPCYMNMESFHTLLDQADYDRFSDYTSDDCTCKHPSCLDEIQKSAARRLLSTHDDPFSKLLSMGAGVCYMLYTSVCKLRLRVGNLARELFPRLRR